MSKPEKAAPATPSAAPPTWRRADRFELKYWVPEAAIPSVIEYAAPYLIADEIAGAHGGPNQCTTSLYLETPSLGSYHRHIESSPDRFKLRVRAYGNPPSGLAFFEVKRKVKSVIVKKRAALPLEDAPRLIEGTWDQLPPSLNPVDRRNLEQFLYLATITRARPYVLVRAYRESYCSADPLEDIRLTIDRRVASQRASGPTLDGDPKRWTPIDGQLQHGERGRHAMLELKFPGIAPLWMRRLVERLDMRCIAYSKYVAAVRCLLDERWSDTMDLRAVPGPKL